jgi:ribosomal protein S18 acetylase RimI-like enzyme
MMTGHGANLPLKEGGEQSVLSFFGLASRDCAIVGRMPSFLRPTRPDDEEFLFNLYASTRESEFAALGWNRLQMEPLLRMQFAAQRHWYEAAYPGSDQQIAMIDGTPGGRMIVHRAADAVVLVDISLMPEHRGKGIGEMLLRDLLERSAKQGLPVRLQVLKNNPAAHLYERLGFLKTGEDQMYWHMERKPENGG